MFASTRSPSSQGSTDSKLGRALAARLFARRHENEVRVRRAPAKMTSRHGLGCHFCLRYTVVSIETLQTPRQVLLPRAPCCCCFYRPSHRGAVRLREHVLERASTGQGAPLRVCSFVWSILQVSEGALWSCERRCMRWACRWETCACVPRRLSVVCVFEEERLGKHMTAVKTNGPAGIARRRLAMTASAQSRMKSPSRSLRALPVLLRWRTRHMLLARKVHDKMRT